MVKARDLSLNMGFSPRYFQLAVHRGSLDATRVKTEGGKVVLYFDDQQEAAARKYAEGRKGKLGARSKSVRNGEKSK